MKLARSTMVTAGVSAAAALAVTGITYASAASGPAPQAAPAATAPAAASAAPFGGDSGQNKGNNNEGQGKGNEGKGNEGWHEEGRHHEKRREEGRIEVNERSYSAHPGDCITVVSGLGAKTLNVRNDSHKRVEVFRGAVCDNGAPIATVGPHSSSFGVDDLHTRGIHVEHGVVASFRVVCDHDDHGDRDDRGDRGDHGDGDWD